MHTTRFLSLKETVKWLGRNGPVRSLRIQSYIEEQKRTTIEAVEARNARQPPGDAQAWPSVTPSGPISHRYRAFWRRVMLTYQSRLSKSFFY